MLFVPISTDAPIYHWPIATISLIVANVLVFGVCVWGLVTGNIDYETLERFALSYETIHPLQWVTSVFLHAGPFHLMGNMFFLWAFGLIVEGKVGAWKFLLIYLGIAVGECIVEQLMMLVLVGEGYSLGASSAVFGLMMIALIWAPENDVECVLIFGLFLLIRALAFEVKVVTLAMLFLFLQIVEMFVAGFSVSSGLLHMLGALVGAPIGLWMLHTGRVDCENWDVISRNEWLQEYEWLCPPSRREAIQREAAIAYDPVAAALASKHSQVDANSTYAQRQSASATQVKTKRGFLGRKKRGSNALAAAQAAMNASQSHPEFNRLSMLLRQAIASGTLSVANSHFAKLEQLAIATGLSDKTLFDLAKLYAAGKQFVPATGPLQIIADRDGLMSNEARLRLAQIQLKVMRRADLATESLNQIHVDEKKPTEAQQKSIARRDQLLTMCRAAATPP
ncbi:rhomboid family intramembrane serine protease [Rhodopirellula sp. P2]|uniref:rhomboid family intramembrane serine protease n=1 Tax=Rhodopirellula sp. P2 TaxID=2127060 RepID=UPI002367B61C|nr:rhomboid family intramembrane serine protease [Rhodopirellula sp. P2]WDQ16663.1 rhomboid family intramembrane serine protease [Rhodopirellula sp. P2]